MQQPHALLCFKRRLQKMKRKSCRTLIWKFRQQQDLELSMGSHVHKYRYVTFRFLSWVIDQRAGCVMGEVRIRFTSHLLISSHYLPTEIIQNNIIKHCVDDGEMRSLCFKGRSSLYHSSIVLILNLKLLEVA